jgi:competence protein ComEA
MASRLSAIAKRGRFDALRQLDEVLGLAGKLDNADRALLKV